MRPSLLADVLLGGTVFERDTRKLLAYYKHVVPGSMADSDLHVRIAILSKEVVRERKSWVS